MKLKCLLAMLLLTFLSCSNTPAVEDKIDSLPQLRAGENIDSLFLMERTYANCSQHYP